MVNNSVVNNSKVVEVFYRWWLNPFGLGKTDIAQRSDAPLPEVTPTRVINSIDGMKLETEADDSLCLFISAERRISGGAEPGGCSAVVGERAHSAQGPIDKLSGSQPPSVADHIIIVAPRITASGRGTPSAGDSTPPTTNGFQNGHHQYQVPKTTTITSLINCEHFRFIDDEDVNDDEDVCDGAADSVGELPTCEDDGRCYNHSNGIPNTDIENADECALQSSSVPSADGEKSTSPDRLLQAHDFEAQVEVSEQLNTSKVQTDLPNSNDIADPISTMSDEHKSKKEKRKKKESESERHQQQQQFVRPIRCNCHNMKDLKSVLKKGQSDRSGKKGRVTFDESVTLYSDEYEDVQLLALRSAPEVNCAEVFYMFEPPIEYQDLLQPFEPPAEYRDPDTSVGIEVSDVATTSKILLEGNGEINLKETNVVLVSEDVISQSPVPDEVKEEKEETVSASDRNENTNVAETAEANSETNNNDSDEKGFTEAGVDVAPTVVPAPELEVNPTEESEKLFERFLEAEREFAEDEDLNRVFHVLEADDFAANDEKCGTFDDNFFKKLIDLLSSVEGDVQLRERDFFTTTDFSLNDEDFGFQNDMKIEKEEEDAAQQHSRTVSEADSDCSVSSQDTIIVRLGDEDATAIQSHAQICRQLSESDQSVENAGLINVLDETVHPNEVERSSDACSDDVFREKTEAILSVDESFCSDESLSKQQLQSSAGRNPSTKSSESSNNTGDLSRQSSVEQPQKDSVQDADDSTSSDSRSGEVEEDIRLDDIGYDEEDADDYDEECLRGMVRGNSKIRRIIKKNALQCTLLRGIEARRRGQSQPNVVKYPRPKSPPLSQESLVEQLKWLTTMDNEKEMENTPTFGSKPPDVILSTGSVPLNGNLGQCPSSEDEINGRSHHRPPQHYQTHQPRHLLASDGKGLYVIAPQSGSGYTFPAHGPPRLWHPVVNPRAQVPPQQQRPYTPRGVVHPMPSSQMPSHQDSERVAAASPVPRDFRDWRVIQRVMMVDRGNGNNLMPRVGFRRCPNGSINACYPRVLPPNVGRPLNIVTNDELEQFVQQDSQRIERIRKRYSVAEDEEEDDPTFGFACRPSVRGVQSRLPPSDHQPSDLVLHTQSADVGLKHLSAYATTVNELPVQRSVPIRQRATMNHEPSWNRGPNWMPGELPVGYCVPEGSGIQRAQPIMPVHRASVALTDLSGCATLPHSKTHSDPRYHSYAESAYGGSQTLPHKRWPSVNSRSCLLPGNNAPATLHHHQMQRTIGPPGSNLQVPPTLPHVASDERGVPEGASSSPKVSSDSLYHAPPMQETVPPIGSAHKDDSVIYYSMNV